MMNRQGIDYVDGQDEFDSEKSGTETKLGWQSLQLGDHKNALEHFKQALIYFPYNESAKAGMVESLKAKYWFYRIFLKYVFWIGEKNAGAQWGVILGFYIGYRFILFIDKQFPNASIVTTPLIILYLLFALTTWIMRPISNLFLRLNSYGKFALDAEQIQCSNLLGTSLLLALLSGGSYLIFGNVLFAMLGGFFFGLSIPVGSLFVAPKHSNARRILIVYTITMMVIGVFAIVTFLDNGDPMNKFSGIFILAFSIYQWVANALIIR